MQLKDLMQLFREGQNEGRKRGYVTQGACDAEGIAAVIRALRDEIVEDGNCKYCVATTAMHNEILGDAGAGKVAGGLSRLEREAKAGSASSPAPATAPAPVKELVKRLRHAADTVSQPGGILFPSDWRDAADALEEMAGQLAFERENNRNLACAMSGMRGDMDRLTAERDRMKAALDALEAVRSDLPEKVSEQWLYEGVRHWHRNCDWDEPRDGLPLDRGDGATVAKILNMIPRKALGGDA